MKFSVSVKVEANSGRCIMKISARNVLKGKIKQITPGAVNSEIIVEVAGGVEMVSIITKSSAERLGLKTGKEVYAIVKASSVMIGVD
jgi:molybdopterin-binding protein